MLGLHAYHCSLKLGASSNQPYYALIAAAMRLGDAENVAKLREAFPSVWDELQARYNAPLGVIPSDGEMDMDLLSMSIKELDRQK